MAGLDELTKDELVKLAVEDYGIEPTGTKAQIVEQIKKAQENMGRNAPENLYLQDVVSAEPSNGTADDMLAPAAQEWICDFDDADLEAGGQVTHGETVYDVRCCTLDSSHKKLVPTRE